MMKKSSTTNDATNLGMNAPNSNSSTTLKKDQSILANDQKSGNTTRRRLRSRRSKKKKVSGSNSTISPNIQAGKNGQKLPLVVCENAKTSGRKLRASNLKDKAPKFPDKPTEISNRLGSKVLPEGRRRTRHSEQRKCSQGLQTMSCSDPPTRCNTKGSNRLSVVQQNKVKENKGAEPTKRSQPNKQQQRGRSKAKESLWAYFNKHNPSKETNELDSLTCFLLDLLITLPDEREMVIAMEACNRRILLQNRNSWMINPTFVKWQKQPFQRVHEEMCRIHLAGKRFIGCSFENQVNSVVQNGLSEEQQKEFTLPAIMNRRKINYFNEGESKKHLEAFAQKCVEANLGVIVESDVRISANNREHGFIQVPDSERDAMLPSQLLRKFALQGDIVRAFVRNAVEEEETADEQKSEVKNQGKPPTLDESVDMVIGKRCKAFVIKIVKEVNNRLVVGNFLPYRENIRHISFVPRDKRIPLIRIYQKDWPESFRQGKIDGVPDMLYVAEITSWENGICIGKIKQSIGKCGELDSESWAIPLKHNLRCELFDDKFNEQYSGEYIISEEEVKRREDLRQECIFTIDPITAQNLDDAISIKELPDGNFEVGVHISDVAFFLAEDSELDQLVKKRTTSVYMVNEVFHMLPKSLCFRCSLLPGKDKLGFSVFWTMSPNADILETRFTRSIIRSCTQLAYEHAQMIIDNPEREFLDVDFPQIYNGFAAIDIVRRVKQLNALANIMRAKRFENGALEIDRIDVYFELDPKTGAPITFHKREEVAANLLIKEFMLLANQSVAEYIYEKFPNISILQNHQPPFKDVLNRVKDQLLKIGLLIDAKNSKSLHSSLVRLISESENPDLASICWSRHFSKLLTRSRYFCTHNVDYEHFKHYGLSIPIYTHFTSPIRRYSDVLVHRILAAALGYTQVPKCTPTELKTLAEHCNDDKYNAKQASRDSTDLYFLHYIQSKGCVVMQAVVIEVYSNSCEVILLETGTLLSIRWQNCSKVQVFVSKDAGVSKVKLVYPSQENKHVDLKPCSEIWLEVTAKSNQLNGNIVPPPVKNNPDNCVPINAELNRETTAKGNVVEPYPKMDRISISELVTDDTTNTVGSYLPNLGRPRSSEVVSELGPHASEEDCNNRVTSSLSALSCNANSSPRVNTYDIQPRVDVMKTSSQELKISHIAFNFILLLLSESLHFWHL